MIHEIYLPKLTHDMQKGLLIRWLKKENDLVKKGDILFEVETDKAVSEVEAEEEGYLRGIKVEEGEEAPVGGVIAFLTSERDEELPAEKTARPASKGLAAAAPVPQTEAARREVQTPSSFGRIIASPIARKMAADHAIDLNRLSGSGPHGRIIERDIKAYLAEARQQKGGKATSGTTLSYVDQPLSRAGQIMAARMLESIQSIPQFAVEADVRWDEVIRYKQVWQEQNRRKLSFTAVLVRAAARVIGNYPLLNASCLEQETVRIYREINVGVALQTPDALLVPVIHHAPLKSLSAIMDLLEAYKESALRGAIQPEALAGGTLTISNLGMYGVDRFTALINPPQTAILAVGRIREAACKQADGIVFRSFVTLSLSSDHRVVTGVYAGQFLKALRELLEEPQEIFEEEEDER